MIPFPDYKTATNAAYKLLAELDRFSVATNVFLIADCLDDCRVFTYSQAVYLYNGSLDTLLSMSEYGFSIKNGGKRIILYNEKMPLSCIRFTLAHEIGHAVLKHQNEGDKNAEKEANCFARNLLCPLPVAAGLQIETAQEYVSVFNVSIQMAHITIDHRSSDAYYIDRNYSVTISDKLYLLHLGFESITEFEEFLYA